MFKSIVLENFQSFMGFHEAELNQINLVYGPNSSGKSSLIRALRTLGEGYSKGHFADLGFGHGFNLRSAEATVYGQLQGENPPRKLSYGFSLQPPSNMLGITALGSTVSRILGATSDKNCFYITVTVEVTDEIRASAEEASGETIIGNKISLNLRLTEVEGVLKNHETSIANYGPKSEALLETLFLANGTWGELPDGHPDPSNLVSQWDDRHKHWDSSWEQLLLDLTSMFIIQGPQFTLGQSDVDDFDPANWVQLVNREAISSINRAGFLAAILERLFEDSRDIFSKLEHVPAIRAIPEKLSSLQSLKFVNQVDVSNSISKALLELTEGRYSDISRKFKIPETGEFYYSNVLHDHFTGADVTFDEVGAGISQVYPALVSLFDDSRVVYMEQPELHLHPRMQAHFMDLVISAAKDRPEKQFILETHSESLLLRLQKRIRQGIVKQDRTCVLFIDKIRYIDPEKAPGAPRRTPSEITTIQVDQVGDLLDPLPVSFVDLRLIDLL